MSRSRVEPAAVDPDDDREAVGAVVDAGVGVDLGRVGRGVVRDEDVEVEAILARLRAGMVRGNRTEHVSLFRFNQSRKQKKSNEMKRNDFCKFYICPMTVDIIVPGSVDGGAGKVCEELVLPLDAARGGGGGVARVIAPPPIEHVLRWPESANIFIGLRL